jgi:murein DD-endopeptidase MepM/ murein hydrolase activator NlpD
MLFFITSLFSSCSNIAEGTISSALGAAYTAKDRDIDDAELNYTDWETALQEQINSAESDYPGFDEYRYSVDDIGHDPFELMAYLTARYQDFQYFEIEAELRAIFEEQYELTFIPEVEIRYNDPGDANEDGDLEPYEWKILNITLTARSFSDIITPRMDAQQRERFGVYMETKGSRQYLINPVAVNWLPLVTDYYGWRIHPATGLRDFHTGIDIALPAGTEIIAGHDGVILQTGDAGGLGPTVALEGKHGLVSKYAQCSEILVSAGQKIKKGDVIAKSGAHLHLEILKNGQALNPLFFSETGDEGSRLPPGAPGGEEFPAYPGAPMEDARFAAMMEEAQKHLGKPYVFGASGPDRFDCSGFVCYVLNHSGVASVGRTSAQGLYNRSTPVSPENAKPGDLVFFSGTYSTPNDCTHVAIYVGNGQMIHAGKPVKYSSLDHEYWQEHFYSFARIG